MPAGGDTVGGSPVAGDADPFAEGAAGAQILARSDVVYALEVEPLSAGWTTDFEEAIGANVIAESPDLTATFAAEPFYVATRPFATGADQSPSNTPFKGRLSSISIRRSISNGSDFGGVVLGDGEIVIDNADGRYDGRWSQTIAGRDVTVRVGRTSIAYQYWPVIFRGTAREWVFDEQGVRIAARDYGYKLTVPIQTTLYAGTGGAEGADDIAGKRKPLVLGRVSNVSPPRINAASLVYQIHDGELDVISAVRDRGVALSFGENHADYATLVAATIAGGEYDTCLALGLIRLGGSPNGTVTADAATYRTGGVSPLSDIVRGIIADRTAITDFYEGAWSTLLAQYPNDAGIYVDENESSTVKDVVDRLIASVAGWVAFTRDGQCSVGRVVIPDNPARMYFGLESIIGTVSLERLPSDLSPPPWRMRLSYQPNFTAQTDLAGAADSYYSQPSKTHVDSDANVLDQHPFAQDGAAKEGFLYDSADALAEVGRQFAIYKTERPLRRVTLSRKALPMEIGQVIDLGYDRVGGRRLGMVVEDDIDVPKGDQVDSVEVMLYG